MITEYAHQKLIGDPKVLLCISDRSRREWFLSLFFASNSILIRSEDYYGGFPSNIITQEERKRNKRFSIKPTKNSIYNLNSKLIQIKVIAIILFVFRYLVASFRFVLFLPILFFYRIYYGISNYKSTYSQYANYNFMIRCNSFIFVAVNVTAAALNCRKKEMYGDCRFNWKWLIKFLWNPVQQML